MYYMYIYIYVYIYIYIYIYNIQIYIYIKLDDVTDFFKYIYYLSLSNSRRRKRI